MNRPRGQFSEKYSLYKILAGACTKTPTVHFLKEASIGHLPPLRLFASFPISIFFGKVRYIYIYFFFYDNILVIYMKAYKMHCFVGNNLGYNNQRADMILFFLN